MACGLGGPSDGLHDPTLERINWNVAAIVFRESRLMPFRIRKMEITADSVKKKSNFSKA